MTVLKTDGLCSSLHTIGFKSDLGYASQGVDKKHLSIKNKQTKKRQRR